MNPRAFNVLFLCSGNSARSIMAECAINRWGEGFKGFSAGSHPLGEIHPMTLEVLKELNYDTLRLRSKSWDEFARPDSPPIDLVLTHCDDTAGQTCPVWPGKPLTAHWGVSRSSQFRRDRRTKAPVLSRNLSGDRVPYRALHPFAGWCSRPSFAPTSDNGDWQGHIFG